MHSYGIICGILKYTLSLTFIFQIIATIIRYANSEQIGLNVYQKQPANDSIYAHALAHASSLPLVHSPSLPLSLSASLSTVKLATSWVRCVAAIKGRWRLDACHLVERCAYYRCAHNARGSWGSCRQRSPGPRGKSVLLLLLLLLLPHLPVAIKNFPAMPLK